MSHPDHAVGARRSGAESLVLGALLLLVAAVPLISGRTTAASLPLEPVIAGMALVLVAAAPFLRRLGARRLPSYPLEVPALAFLAIAALSVVFARYVGQALLTWLRYAMYLALPVAVAAVSVRASNRRLLSWAFMGSGAATMAVAAYQLLVPSAANTQFGFEGVRVRVFSVFLNPNPYSEYLLFYIALALALALTEKRAPRVVAGVLLVLACGTLGMTYTRGSWIGLIAGGLVGMLLLDFRALTAFLAACVVALLAIPGALTRFLSGLSVGDSTQSRVSLWRLALYMIAKSPVIGVGIGGYPAAIEAEVAVHPEMAAGLDALKPHNSFLLLAAEIGVIGGIAFIWLVWRACRIGFVIGELARGDARLRAENACYTLGTVAFAVSALTNNSFQNPRAAVFFWIILGIQFGAASKVMPRTAGESATGAPDVATGDHGVPPALRPARDSWRRTILHRWLVAPPRTGGTLLAGSRLGHVLFGDGAAESADLADWEVKAG